MPDAVAGPGRLVKVSRRPGNPGLKGKLLNKSVEAYILALETINRLSVTYRVETFAYLICNAWELLLKAKILDDTRQKRAIYYSRQRGERPRTLALRDCLKRVFPNERDSTRRNVELVAELRDEAVHLVVGQIPKDVLSLLQASVLNYHRLLNLWFDLGLSDRVPVGMMTLVYDLSPDQTDLRSPILRRRLGKDAADYLTQFEADVRREHEELGKPSEFAVEIRYGITIEKGAHSGQISLTAGPGGTATRILEVAKDPSRTHPFRQKELVVQVNSALKGQRTVNQYDIHCVIEAFNIKKRPEYHYRGQVPGNPDQYSPEFVVWMASQHGHDSTFFSDARQKVARLRARARSLAASRASRTEPLVKDYPRRQIS